MPRSRGSPDGRRSRARRSISARVGNLAEMLLAGLGVGLRRAVQEDGGCRTPAARRWRARCGRASGCCGTSRRGCGAGLIWLSAPTRVESGYRRARSRRDRRACCGDIQDRPIAAIPRSASARCADGVDEARHHDPVRGVDHLGVIGDYDGANRDNAVILDQHVASGQVGNPRSMVTTVRI